MENKTAVSAVACEDYNEKTVELAMTKLIEQIDGLDFVKPGMKVGIKLNLVSAMKPEEAATTHPELVKAICRMIMDKGAEVVLGDSPGGPYISAFLNSVYNATGMTKVAEETGARLNDDFGTKDVLFPEATMIKKFTVTNWLTEVDAIINFSKLKTHGMMGMSAAVKNLFGTIPGTMKPEYHFRFPDADCFADMLVDLNEYWKPSLNIVDAIIGMEGNGPTAGTPRKIGMLLASRSPYNADLVGCHLIGIDPMDVPFMKRAHERELCGSSYKDAEVIGTIEDHVISDYKLLTAKASIRFGGTGRFSKVKGDIVGIFLKSKPKVKKAECIGCRKCEQICPAKAITMVENKPVIDRQKCIRCFCCQEFCPKGAMKVHRTWIARILTRG